MLIWLAGFLCRFALGERCEKPRAQDWRAASAELFLIGVICFFGRKAEWGLPQSSWSIFAVLMVAIVSFAAFVIIVSRLPNLVAVILAPIAVMFIVLTLLAVYGIV